MSRKKKKNDTTKATSVNIHEAALAKDGSGGVHKGKKIDESAAITRRKAGGDVVVCGSTVEENRGQAREIERQACGTFVYHDAHDREGLDALPHFQPATRPPAGHTFFEGSTKRYRAKK